MRQSYVPTLDGYSVDDCYIPTRYGRYTPYGTGYNVRPILWDDINADKAVDSVYLTKDLHGTSVQNLASKIRSIVFYIRFESVLSRLFL